MFHDLSRTNILTTITFSVLTCYFAWLRPDILVTGISLLFPHYFTSSGTDILIKGFSSLVLLFFTYLRPDILSQKYRLYSEISWLVGPAVQVTSFWPLLPLYFTPLMEFIFWLQASPFYSLDASPLEDQIC